MEYTIKNRTEQHEIKQEPMYGYRENRIECCEYTDVKFTGIEFSTDIDRAIIVLKGLKEAFKKQD